MNEINNTKVEGSGNNLKLKAQSLKRRLASRFQLLIIYINFMKKTFKKVGGMFSEIRSRKVGKKTAGKSEGVFTYKPSFQISPAYLWIPDIHRLGEMMRKVGVVGLVVVAFAAVWMAMPIHGARRWRCKKY